MTALVGAGALLLLAAGALKLVDPSRTAGALAALGWPASPALVRSGALVEAVAGAAALVVGGRVLAALVALSYAGFAAFVVAALRSGTPVGSCGCLGRADTPPRWSHVAVDAALATGALAGVVAGAPPLAGAAPGEIAAAGALAVLAYVALTARAPVVSR
ncbi:MAG TPA: MauE/DoxX family redox-associated membrane protein [Acidimicrobiales bacterium]